jgi:hypothetical protein
MAAGGDPPRQACCCALSVDAYAALTTSRPSLTENLLSGPAWPDDMVELINDRTRDTGNAYAGKV